MKKAINIEAEGKELILRNQAGDHVIIPVKYRQEVLDMIKEGCHGCIDNLVSTLPTTKSYAEKGTVIGGPIKTEIRKQINEANEPVYANKAKATTDRYRNLNWVQRGLKPDKYPSIQNEDGTVSTHRLAYAEADGKYHVYPTIIQDEKGALIQLDDKQAMEYAFKTKTTIPFKSKAEAEYYSRNGLIKH